MTVTNPLTPVGSQVFELETDATWRSKRVRLPEGPIQAASVKVVGSPLFSTAVLSVKDATGGAVSDFSTIRTISASDNAGLERITDLAGVTEIEIGVSTAEAGGSVMVTIVFFAARE
jgi:hypothetical protein